MIKIIAGIAIGFVIGAATLRFLSKRMPELIRRIEDEAERTATRWVGAAKTTDFPPRKTNPIR
jgi:hypothetical protein